MNEPIMSYCDLPFTLHREVNETISKTITTCFNQIILSAKEEQISMDVEMLYYILYNAHQYTYDIGLLGLPVLHCIAKQHTKLVSPDSSQIVPTTP